MKSPTVHLVSNISTTDEIGRMVKFGAAAMCGRSLAKPMLVTDNGRVVTCRTCLKWVKKFRPRDTPRG